MTRLSLTPALALPPTLASLCLLLAVVVLYSSGVGTGYIFDDMVSVAPLTVLAERPSLFWAMVFNDGAGLLGRSVSIFTFAAEQVLFSASPEFSQFFNLSLHACNTILVYRILALTFPKSVDGRVAMSLLLAALWGLSPQKVSSVLYIVQRMNLLASFFMLTGVYAYLRLRAGSARNGLWAAVVCCCVALAPFAKENGILLVPILGLFEVFYCADTAEASKARWPRWLAIGILLAGVAMFVLGFLYYERIQAMAYADRGFSLNDRTLLTPTVLLDYARQFFVPDVRVMGVLHDDYCVSGACRNVALDLIALGLVFFGACLSLLTLVRGKQSLLALGIGVFLVGHCIESTYLPLEIYFEHRNYFPSLGLLYVLVWVIDRYRLPRKPVITIFAAYVGVLALSTFSYTGNWSSHRTLVNHHLEGHPRSSRAHAELAMYQAADNSLEAAYESIDQAYEYSVSEAAAKAMTRMDANLMRISASCVAAAAPPLPSITPDLVNELGAFRSASVQVFKREVERGVCPDFPWEDVSNWLLQYASTADREGVLLSAANLRDLSYLEMEFGDPLRTYVYGKMLLERAPLGFHGNYIALAASLELGETETASQTLRQLIELAEERSLNRAKAQVICELLTRYGLPVDTRENFCGLV